MASFNISVLDPDNAAELSALAALAQELWHDTYDPLLPNGQVDYMIEKYQSVPVLEKAVREEGYRYYLAWDGGTLAGYCGVKPETDKRALFLSKIYVGLPYRRQGLARMFVNRALQDYAAFGLTYAYLTVNKENTRAIQSYKALGFETHDAVVTDIGGGYVMDDYIMQRAFE